MKDKILTELHAKNVIEMEMGYKIILTTLYAETLEKIDRLGLRFAYATINMNGELEILAFKKYETC
jgi:hypothetical protein